MSSTPRANIGLRQISPMSVLTNSAYRMLIAAMVLVAILLALRHLDGVVALLRRRPVHVVVVGVSLGLGLVPVLLTIAEGVRRRALPHPTRSSDALGARLGDGVRDDEPARATARPVDRAPDPGGRVPRRAARRRGAWSAPA